MIGAAVLAGRFRVLHRSDLHRHLPVRLGPADAVAALAQRAADRGQRARFRPASSPPANAWMNTPAGFASCAAQVVDVHPLAAIFNPAWPAEVLHTTLAAYVLTGFGAAAVCAFALLAAQRGRSLRAAHAACASRCCAAVARSRCSSSSAISSRASTPSTRPSSWRRWRPIPHAARRGDQDRRSAVGDGIRRATRSAIPGSLSLLAFEDPHAEVDGPRRVPRRRPAAGRRVHLCFDTMVGCGRCSSCSRSWWASSSRCGERGRRAACSRGDRRCRVLSRSSRWKRAGWSPSTAASRGSRAACCAPPTPSPPRPRSTLQFYGFSVLYVFLAATCGGCCAASATSSQPPTRPARAGAPA